MSDEPEIGTELDRDEDEPVLEPREIDNAASPQQIRRKHERARKAKEEVASLWATLLSSAAGRKEIWAFLVDCGTFENRFGVGPNGAPQPEASWFHAGQAAVGQKLYRKLLRLSFDNIHKMHVENDPEFVVIPPPRRAGQ